MITRSWDQKNYLVIRWLRHTQTLDKEAPLYYCCNKRYHGVMISVYAYMNFDNRLCLY